MKDMLSGGLRVLSGVVIGVMAIQFYRQNADSLDADGPIPVQVFGRAFRADPTHIRLALVIFALIAVAMFVYGLWTLRNEMRNRSSEQ